MATVAKLPTPAWVVTLDAGLHATPYENAPDPHDELVVATSIDFWDATLRNDDAAAAGRLAADANGARSLQRPRHVLTVRSGPWSLSMLPALARQ